jgi:hypothetical protein
LDPIPETIQGLLFYRQIDGCSVYFDTFGSFLYVDIFARAN